MIVIIDLYLEREPHPVQVLTPCGVNPSSSKPSIQSVILRIGNAAPVPSGAVFLFY